VNEKPSEEKPQILDPEESKRLDSVYDDILVSLLDILNYLH